MAEDQKMRVTYEKLNEKGEVQRVGDYTIDADGKITGKVVINVKAYFDENPQERIRLGWTKHISYDKPNVEYNKQTQFLVVNQRQVDEYTIEDVYHVMDKSEEQMAFEEMLQIADRDGIIFN